MWSRETGRVKEVKKMDWLINGENNRAVSRKEQTFSRNLVKEFKSTKDLSLVSGSVSWFYFVCSMCMLWGGRQ